MSEARKLTDHAEIRKRAESRGAVPTVAEGTEGGGGAGVPRVDFGKREPRLRQVDWGAFFATFDKRRLVLLAQDEIGGKTSRFFKFVEC